MKGERKGTRFEYVNDIGYDEYGQRVYVEYGTGIRTDYTYDPYRRLLKNIKTVKGGNVYQDINYAFDPSGNVTHYENRAYNHTTSQTYTYDGLYQLTSVTGKTASHAHIGANDYTAGYTQKFDFDIIGNMTGKVSSSFVSDGTKTGANLDYDLEYKYYKGTHKAERIGDRYYSYDLNGNLVAERDGEHAKDTEVYRPYNRDGEIYTTEYGFGFVRPQGRQPDDGIFQRNYKWNERNLLSESSDSAYTVQYRYGADGQRAIKYVMNTGKATLYYNNMWQISDATLNKVQSKHIYVGETRIATKSATHKNDNTQEEQRRIYFYHSDHLGNAQTVTDYEGKIHERLEYTPYGELWIDYRNPDLPGDSTPFRFTGKEMDQETGLYYYGARYLDPRTSRWLTTDPAMYQGDYIPGAPINDEAKKRNGNLPGQGGVFNYVNLHVYHYAGNNPVKYTDPTGRIIKLYGKEKERKYMLGLINENSYIQYDIDKNGILYATDKVKEGRGSSLYSKIINQGIENKGSLSIVFLAEEGAYKIDDKNIIDLNKRGGGYTSYLEEVETGRILRNTITSGITGKSHVFPDLGEVSAADILMHELACHSVLLGLGGMDNMNAIDMDNLMRTELGLKLREKDINNTVKEQ